MTDEERKNRNPKPEPWRFRPEECPELFIKDLEFGHVYILHGRREAKLLNYAGKVGEAHHFIGPRAGLHLLLHERPDKSGTLEDGAGLKVTIRKYTGPDA